MTITETDKKTIAKYISLILNRKKPLPIENLPTPLREQMMAIRSKYTPTELTNEITSQILLEAETP